jgi:DNA-binding transcriptional ArsR family regulator
MSDETTPDLPERAERVLDAGALRALAHPLRIQIYDILTQWGPQTASSLASMTGESSGATSYHLRALAKHDLIREVEGRGTGRERWWERPRGSVSFVNPDAIKSPSGRAASQVVMSEFMKRRQEQLLEFIGGGLLTDDPWENGAMISTATAELTPEQSADLIKRIQALVNETVDKYRTQDAPGTRTVTIRNDIFPLPVQGH